MLLALEVFPCGAGAKKGFTLFTHSCIKILIVLQVRFGEFFSPALWKITSGVGKGVWFVFVSPRRIPCNAQGNKLETLLDPETEKPHELGPHVLCSVGTVQC